MTEQTVVLLEQIGAMIDAPVDGNRADALERIERTLTDGYAHALSLEAERWRLERRIGEVASELTERNKETKADELSSLARRASQASGELTRLRGLLASLRERAGELREPVAP
jgi:DNA repair exonuclease SbcCD ATPase subunit